jgi:hypothetical protein
MSTTMTELDRQAAVAVFRASLPRRGAKGRNDRLFLEALHHHLASAAEALRQMERRVEAVRAVEQSCRVRDVLRPSGLVQFIGASDHAAVVACLVSNLAQIGAPTQAA